MKKKLNKQIRLEVYEKMLVILRDYASRDFYHWGYCLLLAKVSDCKVYNTEIKYFPELYKRRPPRSERIGAFWFYRTTEGTLKRIALLEKVIAEMKK